jgi:hypothetical protein
MSMAFAATQRTSPNYYRALESATVDDEALVPDSRAQLSPAQMVDEKLFALLGATDNRSGREAWSLRANPAEFSGQST